MSLKLFICKIIYILGAVSTLKWYVSVSWVLEPLHLKISVNINEITLFVSTDTNVYFTVKYMFTWASTNLTHKKKERTLLFNRKVHTFCSFVCYISTRQSVYTVQSHCFVVNAFECHSAFYLWMHIFVIQFIFYFFGSGFFDVWMVLIQPLSAHVLTFSLWGPL